MSTSRALLLFSGGQDSATCLAWALDRYEHVETVGFDYNQRHLVEMQCRKHMRSEIAAQRPEWANRLSADHILDISALGQISETSLTRTTKITENESGLPSTFVPGRNLIFLTFAGALAYKIGARALVAGMCEADFSGYPDCRAETLTAQMQAINLGMESDLSLQTPLMNLSKAGAWALVHSLGGTALIECILEHSHTCYLGERGTRHDWGYGCGACPACELRAKGWSEYSAAA